jgi:hypothetical protein
MEDIYDLTIKFKIFDKDINECREHIDNLINKIKQKDYEYVVIHLINNNTNNFNKIKNIGSIVSLGKYLNSLQSKIKIIKIYGGKNSISDFVTNTMNLIVGYDVTRIIEYV